MKNTQIALVSPFKSTYKKDKEKKADNNCKAFCISHKHRKQQQQQKKNQQDNKKTNCLVMFKVLLYILFAFYRNSSEIILG